jgi:hypothetical protein
MRSIPTVLFAFPLKHLPNVQHHTGTIFPALSRCREKIGLSTCIRLVDMMANEYSDYSRCVSPKTDAGAGKSEGWLGNMKYAEYLYLVRDGIILKGKMQVPKSSCSGVPA